MRIPYPIVLCSALAVACGGESLRRNGGGSNGDAGANSGGSTSGGAGMGASAGNTTGGSTGTGGGLTGGSAGNTTGGSTGGGDCSNLPPSGYIGGCVRDCATEPNAFTAPECVRGAFACPTGTFPARSCPDESCARRDDWECCTANGTVKPMRCSADGGGTLPCEPGSVRRERGALCVPDGFDDVTACSELEGRPCTNLSLRCHQGAGCGTATCDCFDVPDAGGWQWSCTVVACVE